MADRPTGGVVAAVVLATLALTPLAHAAFPGTNGRIAFQATNGLGTINASGGDRQPLFQGSGVFATPTWSADGKRLAFASNIDGDFEIYAIGAAGGAITQLTHNTVNDGSPSWSPDGSRIAFESERDGPSQIFVMGADGTGVTNLSPNPLFDRAPAWSPDGSRIAFSRGPDGGSANIWVVGTAGGPGTALTADPGDETNPDWSPDGGRIAFQREGGIVVMAGNGNAQSPLPVTGARPAWAPDGSRIVFDSSLELFAVDPDGTDVAQLTIGGSSALNAQAPTWQPIPLSSTPPTTTPPAKGGDPPLLRRRIKASLRTNRDKAYTVFTALAVKPVRRGDVVRLTCKGPGCPLKRATVRVKKRRASLSLLRRLHGAKLRNGAVVQLRVTRKGTVGRVTTWRIRAPKQPRVAQRCLAPGVTKPTRCTS
jgi:TolB protein